MQNTQRDRKIQTNIRSVLIQGGAAKSSQKKAKIVEYSLEKLFSFGELGPLFRNVLSNRLEVIGYRLEEIESDFTELCNSHNFIDALSLSKQEFVKWISGTALLKETPSSKVPQVLTSPLVGLEHKDTISSRKINSRLLPYIQKKDKKVRHDEYINEGWFVVKKLKSEFTFQKNKPHDQAFEEKVWAIFAKAGFGWLNKDRQFKIEYSKKPGVPKKQIDVIAIDDNVAIVTECKSAESRKSKSFQKDIAEISHLKTGIETTLSEVFGKPIRTAYILATSNYVVSDNDRSRMKDAQIFHMDQDEVEYWNNITKELGEVAKYQMFGRLFQHQEIPNLKNRVLAIRGRMGGNTYYSFSLAPEVLLQIGFVLHRTDTTKDAFDSYQRMVKGARLKSISRYITEDEGFFPNSIIINILTHDEEGTPNGLNFEKINHVQHDGETEVGVLTLPNRYRSAFIIDGQHRTYGYGFTDNKHSDQLPIVAFEDLPAQEQTELFIKINHEQKSVPKNLLRTMMAEFNWGSSSPDEAFDALRTRFIHRLNNDDKSALFKRIILNEEKQTNLRCLTLENLLKSGIGPTNFFGQIQKKKLVKTGYFWTGDYDETLKKSFDFSTYILNFLELNCADQWNKGGGDGGFIATNSGIATYFRLVDDLLREHVAYGFEPTKKSALEIYEHIKAYLEPVAEFINSLSIQDIRTLKGKLGSGAVSKLLPEFQFAINQKFTDYNPPGLEQWIKDSSGQFNPKAKELGDRIQLNIRDYVFNTLKEAYGVANWWNDSISKDIQKYCANTAIDQGNRETPENYLLTLHYQKIILDNKDLILATFTPPGMESAKQDKKLDWIGKLNSIRQKYSHPERDKVKEEEYNALVEISEWLFPRLK
jgi:DNA sulfur modification protein DndB